MTYNACATASRDEDYGVFLKGFTDWDEVLDIHLPVYRLIAGAVINIFAANVKHLPGMCVGRNTVHYQLMILASMMVDNAIRRASATSDDR